MFPLDFSLFLFLLSLTTLFLAFYELRQTRKEIAHREGMLHAMVESLHDGILLLDTHENLILVNPAAREILNLPPKVKISLSQITQSLSSKFNLRTKFLESLEKQLLVDVSGIHLADRTFQILIVPVRGEQGGTLGGLVSFHDMTSQEQLERLREDFVAMMVHELRTPLSVVRGTADMFLNNPKIINQKDGKEMLRNLRSSAETMLALVSDFLDVAKIDAGKFEVIKRGADICELVSDRINYFAPIAKEKSIKLLFNGDCKIAPFDFDVTRVSQVLNNLINNALKFTPPEGTIKLDVFTIDHSQHIRPRFKTDILPVLDNPSVVVAIEDSGCGIAEDELGSLFAKFKQASKDSKHKGTGLGLAIVKGIIEAHGGQVFVESRMGSGSTFYFTLPTTAVINGLDN